MSDIYWQVEGCQEAQKKQTKRLVAKVERLQAELAAAKKVLYDISTGHEGDWSCNCPAMGMALDALRELGAAEVGDDE